MLLKSKVEYQIEDSGEWCESPDSYHPEWIEIYPEEIASTCFKEYIESFAENPEDHKTCNITLRSGNKICKFKLTDVDYEWSCVVSELDEWHTEEERE